jgi:hypothetical protein
VIQNEHLANAFESVAKEMGDQHLDEVLMYSGLHEIPIIQPKESKRVKIDLLKP